MGNVCLKYCSEFLKKNCYYASLRKIPNNLRDFRNEHRRVIIYST